MWALAQLNAASVRVIRGFSSWGGECCGQHEEQQGDGQPDGESALAGGQSGFLHCEEQAGEPDKAGDDPG